MLTHVVNQAASEDHRHALDLRPDITVTGLGLEDRAKLSKLIPVS